VAWYVAKFVQGQMSNGRILNMLVTRSPRLHVVALVAFVCTTGTACHRASTERSSGAANPTVRHAGELEGAAPLGSPCELLEREQVAALAHVPVCTGSQGNDPHDGHSVLRTCLRTRDGAWGLVRESPEKIEPERYCALREAAQFGMVGRRELAVRVRATYVRAGSIVKSRAFDAIRIDEPRAFDYDGDGEAELVLSGASPERFATADDVLESDELGFGAILRASDGGVRELAATAALNISGFEDIDGDGRPDVLMTSFIDGADADVGTWTFLGPRLAAHSLESGTFSTDDVAVTEWVRRECRSANLEQVHARGLFRAAMCARLLGASPSEVSKRYGARCRALESSATHGAAGGVDDGVSLSAICRQRTAPPSGPVGIPEIIAAKIAKLRPVVAAAPPSR
jgi:hypothetical protein